MKTRVVNTPSGCVIGVYSDRDHHHLANISLSADEKWLRIFLTERKGRVVRTYNTDLKRHKGAELPAEEFVIDVEV